MIHLVAPEAESDLLDIWRHISRESSARIADRLIDSIIERFLLLSSHSFAGRPRNDLRKDLRAFPIRPYVIFIELIARIY